MLNVAYDHLAYIWQIDILLNSFIIITLAVFNIQNWWFVNIMSHIRNLQISHMSIYYPLTSCVRLLQHFKEDTYYDWSLEVS